MNSRMLGRDIWVKTTDKNRKSWVSYHRVWDIGLFMESQQKEAKKNGSTVEQVMEPKRSTAAERAAAH